MFSLVSFIVPCTGRIWIPYAPYAKARAMKNNRGGCPACLNGHHGTECRGK